MPVEGPNQNPNVDPYAACQEPQVDQDETVAVQELAPLIAESLNITVTRSDGKVTLSGNGGSVTLSIPDLEEAAVDPAEVDFEALIAYLQLENTEKQLKVQQQRIEVAEGRIEADHEALIAKEEELVQEVAVAEAKAKARKVISDIFDFFDKLRFAILFHINPLLAFESKIVGEVLGKVVSKVTEVMAELIGNILEDIVLGFCKMLNIELSKEDKETIDKVTHIIAYLKVLLAEIMLAVVVFHKVPTKLMRSTGKKVGKKVGKEAEKKMAAKMTERSIMKTVDKIVDWTTIGMAALNMVSGILMAKTQRDIELTQAELEEMQAYLHELQTRLQDDEDIAQELLQLINQYAEDVAELLASKTEVDVAITQHIA